VTASAVVRDGAGGQLRKPKAASLGTELFAALPAPAARNRSQLERPDRRRRRTGVVTVGSVLAMVRT